MSSSRSKTLDLTYIALAAALIVICSWICIPSLVMPFTLQTFAVCLIAGILGAKRGALAVIVYLCMAAAGFPVFSGFRGGPGALFGTTGGYAVGFIFTALITGAAAERSGRKIPILAVSMAAGIAACYAFGTFWYMLVYTNGSGAAGAAAVLSQCVFPFIIPDIIKIALAAPLSRKLYRFTT